MAARSKESPAIDAGNNSLIPADSFDLDNDGNTTDENGVEFKLKPIISRK